MINGVVIDRVTACLYEADYMDKTDEMISYLNKLPFHVSTIILFPFKVGENALARAIKANTWCANNLDGQFAMFVNPAGAAFELEPDAVLFRLGAL